MPGAIFRGLPTVVVAGDPFGSAGNVTRRPAPGSEILYNGERENVYMHIAQGKFAIGEREEIQSHEVRQSVREQAQLPLVEIPVIRLSVEQAIYFPGTEIRAADNDDFYPVGGVLLNEDTGESSVYFNRRGVCHLHDG
jgi:hypothetical protein